MTKHVAIIDVGKTNAKLVVLDCETFAEKAVLTRSNEVLPGPPYPHFDVEGHWAFFLQGLEELNSRFEINAISVTTHGACAALLTENGSLAAPVLDYEFAGPDEVAEAYDAIRPAFVETGSPRLAGGLNIGAQLFWMLNREPDLLERTSSIVTYPQYWGFRLTGVRATDVTSLGCHTDLWNPFEGTFSSLVDHLGIRQLMATAKRPASVLGNVSRDVADMTGLAAETEVYCGIHDSNASLLPHLIERSAPFSVLSTGTWVIALCVGGREVELDMARDTLVNVNAFGEPVRSSRFMGGREFDLLLGKHTPAISESDRNAVLTEGIFLLPSVVTSSGPFAGRHHEWVGKEPGVGTPARFIAVSYYLACVAWECLSLAGHQGPILVEGPFARNREVLDMLGALSGYPIYACEGTTGTAVGAAALVTGYVNSHKKAEHVIENSQARLMTEYGRSWKTLVYGPEI